MQSIEILTRMIVQLILTSLVRDMIVFSMGYLQRIAFAVKNELIRGPLGYEFY